MGYLLKEALKTLCGVNQWSYAVFWKIGCQNPRLLIWEDNFYEAAALCSAETSGSRSCVQAGDKAHLLVSKMMMDNHVNIVGEGLVGRVAFTGNYQWILSDSYFMEVHPPEVLKDLGQQFAAGMQTVTVVPVLPHGVVQFGSRNKIMEDVGFVNDVMSLMLQLGHVPGVLLSEKYTEKDAAPRIGVPIIIGNSTPLFSPLQSNVVNASSVFGTLQSSVAAFQTSNTGLSHLKPNDFRPETKMDSALKYLIPPSQLMPKAEVIPSNCEIWTKQFTSDIQGHFSNPNLSSDTSMSSERTNSSLNYCSSGGYVTLPSAEVNELCKGVMCSNMKLMPGIDSVSDAKRIASGELKNTSLSKIEDSIPDSFDVLSTNSSFTFSCGSKNHQMDEKSPQCDLSACFVEDERKQIFGQIHSVNNRDDSCVKPKSGDDLFDVLGADFKNKLLSNCWNSSLCNESFTDAHNWDGGDFSLSSSDNLLDAVVSKVHSSARNQSADDSISCGRTLTNTSSATGPTTSLPFGRLGVKEVMKARAISSSSTRTGFSDEDSRTFSNGSSVYGSQVSSWIGKEDNTKQSNSLSNGYSKKLDEMRKTNRKRSKLGENPRPRPKDRQLIQDRVKELREIVPNGAKCSIDALLERTIKHMFFLQSVTKHADKLKQTGESKIVRKDGGLLLKHDFEGGATWAYEVGSQSVVCPIIVEDLNHPRQMLVEMRLEERGLLLEIADIIRGLGLTILKGLMETRHDKIWARFIVEANRDVTRMEIFMSLVRLLEQTTKDGASRPNDTTSENVMVPQLHRGFQCST